MEMRQMSSLEYVEMVKELEPLCGARLDKFVDYGGKSFRIKIGKTDIAIDAPFRINITKYIRDSPQTPTDLAFIIRKWIGNARLDKVFQHEADRVVAFSFSKDDEKFTLVFEMFSTGNCALLDSKNNCIAAAEYNEWKDREIKQKKQYKFPAAQVARDAMFDVQGVISDKFASACLSRLPIGTIYTNEALARLGIEQKTKGSGLSVEQIKNIEKTLREIAGNPVPALYLKDGKPEEFALTALSGMEGMEKKEFPTLSECADEYYGSSIQSPGKGESALGKEMARLKEMEARQKEHMEGLETRAGKSAASGKAILANMELFEGAIEYARKGSTADNEIAARVMALEKSGRLKIDKKTGRLEIELE